MDRPPRVLVLTSAYPSPASPVAGVFVREHALAAAEHAEVALLHLERLDTHSIRTVRLEDEPFPAWRIGYPRRPKALSLPRLLLAARAGMRRATREGFEPDLIQAHFILAGIPAAAIGRRRSIPVVISEQWTAFLAEDPNRIPRSLELAARLAFNRAALVLPASRPLERALAERGVRTPMRLLENAVDLSLFSPPAASAVRPTRLVLVGLLGPQKGVDVLLRAFASLHEDIPDLTLDVIGDGPDRTRLEALAASLGVSGSAAFHGLQSKARIADLLRRADVYVLASRYENNPNVLIEALASGLPVVATSVGGVPDMVGPDDGVLVPRDDPAALAEGVRHVLGGYEGYDRPAIGARAASRWSRTAIGEQLAEVYDSVLS